MESELEEIFLRKGKFENKEGKKIKPTPTSEFFWITLNTQTPNKIKEKIKSLKKYFPNTDAYLLGYVSGLPSIKDGNCLIYRLLRFYKK